MSPSIAGLRISPVYTAPQSATASTASSTAVEQVATLPSTTVSLGQTTSNEDGRTYSSRGVLGAQVRYALQQDGLDKLSVSLLSGVQSSSLSSRFQGIGAALLEQLVANGGQSVSQSAFAYTDGTEPSAEALKLHGDRLLQDPDNSVKLSLTTVSGATINLTLASSEDGLAVSAEVEGGELSANELKGLASLTDSFQKAINGLTQEPPKLELGALVKLDPALFSSLQMSARLDTSSGEPMSFDLTLDDSARSLELNGPSGNVKLNLDTRDATLLGSGAQRQAAIDNYLTQFDAAQRRGKADKDLVSLFKDAFTQLNSADDGGRTTDRVAVLGEKDRVLLSGLADFTASISQTAKSVNPLLPAETDRFDYQVSQATTVRGSAQTNRSVEQKQQSSLSAAYHESLNPQVALALGRDYESQNYRYHEISDQASSSTHLAWSKNKLIDASVTQQASQSERVRTYVNAEVTDDVSTPRSVSESRNLISYLNDVFERDRKSVKDKGLSILEAQLQDKRSQWLLKASPSDIRA